MAEIPHKIPWGGQYRDPLTEMEERHSQVQPDTGPGQMDPTQPGGQAPPGRVPVRLPGANYPPAGSFAVDEQQDADIPAGSTATVLTFTVPETNQLRLDGIGFGAADEVALRFLTWSLLVNRDPAPAYANVAATVGTIVQVSPIFLHIGGPAVVQLEATSDAAAVLTYRFIARLKGWQYVDRGSL